MSTHASYPIEGGCDCGSVRYRLLSAPLFVHCCHCRWCQRESGSAFALNAMIEADRRREGDFGWHAEANKKAEETVGAPVHPFQMRFRLVLSRRMYP